MNAAKSLLSTGRVPGWLSVRPAAHFKQLLSSESRHFRKIPPGCTVRRSKLLVQQHVDCFLTPWTVLKFKKWSLTRCIFLTAWTETQQYPMASEGQDMKRASGQTEKLRFNETAGGWFTLTSLCFWVGGEPRCEIISEIYVPQGCANVVQGKCRKILIFNGVVNTGAMQHLSHDKAWFLLN